MNTPLEPAPETRAKTPIRYFMLERGHAWNEHTLHSFATPAEREAKVAELIFGDPLHLLDPDEKDQWHAYCKELCDTGSVEFEGDPGLEWFTAMPDAPHPSPACADAAARGDNLGSVLLPLTSTEDASAKGNPAGRSLFSNLAKKLAHEINKTHAQGPWSETQNPDDYIASIILRHCSAHLAPALQGGDQRLGEAQQIVAAQMKNLKEYGTLDAPQPLREVIGRALKDTKRDFPNIVLTAPLLTDRLLTALTPLLAHDKRSDGERTDKERLDWLEKIASDGEDCRSIEMNKVQPSTKKNHSWAWKLFEIKPTEMLPVGNRIVSLEWHRYSYEIRPFSGDEDYGGHWDIQGSEAPTVRAAIDAALAAQTEGKK